MDENKLKELLQRYIAGVCTPDEMALVETWFNVVSEASPSRGEVANYDELKKEIWTGLNVDTTPAVRLSTGPNISWIGKVLLPAAAVAAIVFGVWFFSAPRHPDAGQDPGSAQYASDIAPGKQGATLTLANGKKIKLSDAANGELAKEAGVLITKTASGQLVYEINPSSRTEGRDLSSPGSPEMTNVLSTANGETYQVHLPDGSLVWLNAASTLKYPASFANLSKRKVELTGEGYFQVAKDQSHPFVVESKGQEVEVLGTHFNINSYEGEAGTKTTLLEGSVRVGYAPRHPGLDPGSRNRKATMHDMNDKAGVLTSSSAGSYQTYQRHQHHLVNQVQDDDRFKQNSVILKPNQQALLNDQKQIIVKQVDASEAIAWKNGLFIFENEDIKSVMGKVRRWYNLEIVYEKGTENRRIGGIISRYEQVSQVLEMINATKTVKCRLEGRTIYVGL